MSESPVLYALEAGVATITLNRPQAYNAFTREMHHELFAAVVRAERDPAARVVLLRGAGKAFCSGQDLRELPTDGSLDLAAILRASYNRLILKLRDLPQPVIAAIGGVAAGAGMSLALAADLRVAADNARFATAFAKIGLIPDAGMTYFLPRLIGPARALELCMSGGELSASEAERLGLVNRLFPADELEAHAFAYAQQLANGPRYALSLMKRAFAQSASADLASQLEYEAMAQDQAGHHPDLAEGIAAFLAKRPPNFHQR